MIRAMYMLITNTKWSKIQIQSDTVPAMWKSK